MFYKAGTSAPTFILIQKITIKMLTGLEAASVISKHTDLSDPVTHE